MRCFLGVCLLFVLLFACAKEPASPEEVVRQYANFLNLGQLEAAKALCTPAGEAFLVALGEVMASAEATPDSIPISIRNVECVVTNSSARCQTTEYDGFEEYHTDYWLLQTPEGWRVDQPVAAGETTTTTEEVEE